jgi:large subunit ribosomal protein L4
MTYKLDVHNMKGKVVGSLELSDTLFNDEIINPSLIHEYYLLQQANARISRAHTKVRSEVAGSGRKLYKQKGTGNARVGDLRSPIRRKGGVVFGPRSERNFTKAMNKKARKKALYGLLTIKLQGDDVVVLDKFDVQTPKTSIALETIKAVGLNNTKTLMVLDKKSELIEKSWRNLPNIKCITVAYLNPVDLLSYDKVLFLQAALDKINISK